MRRARFAIATAMLLAIVVPGVLGADHEPAAASSSSTRATGSPVRLAITGMTPQWAGPHDAITVTGTVTNTSRQVLGHLSVNLESSSSAVSDLTAIVADLATQAPVASNPVAGHVTQPAGALQPGASSSWSVTFAAKQIGMTGFGVYPLTVKVSTSTGSQLGYANTFLPYLPAGRGQFARTRPARQQIAWLWPLITTPLDVLPGRRNCLGADARALGASMSDRGPLSDLVKAGGAYSSADKLTWAVDPALLTAVGDLSSPACTTAAPSRAKAAAAWLTQLRKTTSNQSLFATPYANISLGLIRQGHTNDVDKAFQLGRTIAGGILDRNLAPSAASRAGHSIDDASIAWPPNQITSDMLVHLELVDSVRTVVLPSSSVTDAPGTLFQVQAATKNAHVLLSASPLTDLLSAAAPAAGSQFATSQDFLAETALMATQGKANPIVVAPPQRWQASAGLATLLLADTAKAPWLRPTSVSSLSGQARPANGRQLTTTSSHNLGLVKGRVLHQFKLLDQDALQISWIQAPLRSVRAQPTTGVYEAIFALESSAWTGQQRMVRITRLASLASYLDGLQHGVVVVADGRVTLGGLKGNVPILIHNKLGFPVRVQLTNKPDQPPGGGITVTQDPKGLVTVQPHKNQEVTLHVQASQVGSSTLKVRLLNQKNQPLPNPPVSVTVQATQFGMLAMIMLASVLGVFVIVSATRAIRRGRPTPPDNSDDPGHTGSDAGESSQHPPGPDTVVPERSEAGAAGPSGP